jgi:hypothetical protein
MAKETLVEEYITDGVNLINELETGNIQVQAALWFYLTEPEEWRLLIATPIFDEEGSTNTYRRLFDLIRDKNITISFPLSRITVISPNDPMVRLLRNVISTGGGISRVRFQNNVIDNQLIEDALIYKV